MTKEYYYVSDYIEKRDNASKSSGVLGGQAQYYFTDYRTSAFNVGDNVHTEILMNAFSTISVLPASQNTSCHIGYTDVIEKLADNSFTRYQFSNFDNGYYDEPADAIIQLSRTPYESYASKSMDRGKLILQEHYNANGTRIWCKAITYEKDASTNNYVRAMNATNTVVCYNGQAAYDEGTSYKIYTYMLRPKTETITSYNAESGNAMQTTTMQYTYTNKLLQSTAYTNSDGQRKQTVYHYPFDYANTSSIYAEMREKHLFSYVVEKAEITGSGTDARVVDVVRAHYNKTPAGFFKPERVDWSFAETMDLDTYNEQGSAAVLKPFVYYQYDDQGNIAEILSAACYGENTNSPAEALPAGEGTATVYLWGYCGQYLIAKITNCTYQTICNIIGNGNVESGINALKTMSRREAPTEEEWTSINNLRQTLPVSLVTSYTYKPLTGMTSQTDPQGRTIYYEYDNANRLIEIYRMSGGHKEQLQTYEYRYAEELKPTNQ